MRIGDLIPNVIFSAQARREGIGSVSPEYSQYVKQPYGFNLRSIRNSCGGFSAGELVALRNGSTKGGEALANVLPDVVRASDLFGRNYQSSIDSLIYEFSEQETERLRKNTNGKLVVEKNALEGNARYFKMLAGKLCAPVLAVIDGFSDFSPEGYFGVADIVGNAFHRGNVYGFWVAKQKRNFSVNEERKIKCALTLKDGRLYSSASERECGNLDEGSETQVF